MKTQIIEHLQGSKEWHIHRAKHFNASDCAAVLGLSSYKTRNQLLKEKAIGFGEDVDAATQHRFSKGHEFEATARPWAEEIIGSELYPVVLAGDYEGLLLSASLDGLDMASEFDFEHKTGRADLLVSLEQGVIPAEYHPQMEMGLMLSGASKCLFMASSGNKDSMRFAWYLPNSDLRKRIIAAWKQFAEDLAKYVPEAAAPALIGKTPETLPALRIEVTGMVTASNLQEYKSHALAVFAGINRELTTDMQFADAEKTVKWCSDVEDRLAAAKQHALSQTASIDELFRTVDEISAEARRVRLELDKLVKARKEAIRVELIHDAINTFGKHVDGLNARIGHRYMPPIPTDFPGVIKGKRTIDSLRDAVDTELARAKIAANEVADRLQININYLRDNAADHKHLFPDTGSIIQKAPDDLTALVETRIADHKAAELAKEEATRARIQAEEKAKAEAAARLVVAQEAADAAKAHNAAQATLLANLAAVTVATPAPVTAPAANVVPMRVPTVTAKPTTQPSLKLGQIGERLGFSLTGDFLKTLGFKPAARDKLALLFHESSFPLICAALVRHIESIQSRQAA